MLASSLIPVEPAHTQEKEAVPLPEKALLVKHRQLGYPLITPEFIAPVWMSL